ncbi:hypothetical protein A2483_05900 [Candidatus Peregrinibacteria bacterium RIFOXYC2_FULL_33_13]|nr:MAG: hypothetical protein UR27_C0005G0016 [Candidatus Peregrinibacteria bacterium GW2011_GWA2_33_10]KKP39274.1 MAG: hypothetical protein UR30_C0011G0017 [Candidatus Peregrinibacteria bacterium GW2011_GWC2_33_13]OGJ49958.1 MAG: hypothetical protein A2229_01920 [Candidatus Peregrinibacteria bacterium RIFOXYA2_FULL_33_7]OGJ53620.1 MAG: hypothetical protein A2483_05900 [Candidatus Peregrinibacteria bacterium RIFOXYC2_FULL_33_13]
MTKKKDTYSYQGWLISDSFIKRSMASVGYHIMGSLFIWLGLLLFALVVGGVIGIVMVTLDRMGIF